MRINFFALRPWLTSFHFPSVIQTPHIGGSGPAVLQTFWRSFRGLNWSFPELLKITGPSSADLDQTFCTDRLTWSRPEQTWSWPCIRFLIRFRVVLWSVRACYLHRFHPWWTRCPLGTGRGTPGTEPSPGKDKHHQQRQQKTNRK